MPDQPFLKRISHRRIDPPVVTPLTVLPDLIDQAFLSYNAGRLREACHIFTEKLLAYALGRPVGAADQELVGGILTSASTEDYRLPAMLQAIVATRTFRTR